MNTSSLPLDQQQMDLPPVAQGKEKYTERTQQEEQEVQLQDRSKEKNNTPPAYALPPLPFKPFTKQKTLIK
eukprot:3238248-Ditylum_brightwellii.AAC.1